MNAFFAEHCAPGPFGDRWVGPKRWARCRRSRVRAGGELSREREPKRVSVGESEARHVRSVKPAGTGTPALEGSPGDDQMFGGHPHHRLGDALRRWLDEHPEQRDQNRPNGRPAVSHYTGRRAGSPGNPRRFDTLWISPDLSLTDILYDYDAAIEAGSDHALVIATMFRP
jgi:hypothetical protein